MDKGSSQCLSRITSVYELDTRVKYAVKENSLKFIILYSSVQ